MNINILFKVAIAGCANVGKTSLFNLLTGKKNKTGNWEGVTIDIDNERMLFTRDILVFDLPGINTLAKTVNGEDQVISRNFLIQENIDLIINVVSIESIKSDLQLSIELYELNKPMIIVVVDHTGNEVKLDFLNLEVINLNLKKKGVIGDLIKKVKEILSEEKSVRSMKDHCKNMGYDLVLDNNLIDTCNKLNHGDYNEIRKSREKYIDKVTVDLKMSRYRHLSDVIDRVVMNRFFAIPTFILIICSVLFMTVTGGEFFKPYSEESVHIYIIQPVIYLLDKIDVPSFITQTFRYGVGAGVKIIASFIPLLSILYILLGIIDESGYMTRASITMSRIASKIGLSGKSIIPLIIGFGCNVPAIMGTRIIANEKQRLLTIIMIPFMSCGARLTLFALFASAFFPKNGALVICCLYFFSIFLAGIVAFVLQPYFASAEQDNNVQVLPKYRIPNLFLICKHTLAKIKHFILEAGQTIIIISVALYLFSAVPVNFLNMKFNSFENEINENSILVDMSKKLTFIFHPIGISENNWPATVSLVTGVIAKEIVASTLITLYEIQENEKIIPQALVQKYFDNDANAFAYILFVLIYFPCITVFSVMKKEAGAKVAILSSIFYTVLAYIIAAGFHQINTYTNNSITLSLLILMMMILIVGYIGRKCTTRMRT